jgi:cysteinyl-tRNA synthetase
MCETDQVLGVLDETPEVDSEDPEIEALLVEREEARRGRDFARADAIRDSLHERGIEILDTPEGARWRRR